MKPSIATDMYKEFCAFKDTNKLEYQRAWDVLLDLLCAVYTHSATKELLGYQATSLRFFEAYFRKVNENPFIDHLGPVFEKTVREFGKVKNAQHFTPNPIAQLVGNLFQLNDDDFRDKKEVSVNDPCVGFGAMVLGFVGSYKLNKPLNIFINDIDPLCCKASFAQICMAMTARPKLFRLFVTQGDILKFPKGEKLVLTANVTLGDAIDFQNLILSFKTDAS